ncbi:MAG: Plug domain-containing protein [Acidobacteria bacterium]|nr:Plug domain-containing protein [Acidobacteriota bacterium]
MLTANSTVRTNMGLELSTVTGSVQVNAQALSLQTDSADVREEIRSDQLQNLPVPTNRNFQSLLITVPGFSTATLGASVATNPGRALTMSANGVNQAGVSIRVDGTVTQDAWSPFHADYVPNLDAIEVVNVVTGSFDAEQGFAGGVAVNVQIKSGTNDVHGSGSWYHDNNHLKARPYFLPADQGKNKKILNQFGGTVGGPIIRNKLFYFGSYEGSYDRESVFSIGSVPSTLMRVGNFSESTTTIYDPATGRGGRDRQPFANNILPASRISPIIQKLVDLTPLPNLNSDARLNYFANGPFTLDRRDVDTKFTWNATDKLNINARISALTFDSISPLRFEKLEGNRLGGRGDTPGTSDGHMENMTFSVVYTLSPNWVFDAYFGLSKRHSGRTPLSDDLTPTARCWIPVLRDRWF